MKKYKSIYILTIYRGGVPSKDSYSSGISAKMLEFFTQSSPGFNISDSSIAYFMSLEDAEKYIKKLVKKSLGNIYGFSVVEKPFGRRFPFYQSLSQRRYLKDGTLWQKCEISNVNFIDGMARNLGNTKFFGRDPKTVPFKEGDIVEVAGSDFVELGIVWCLPPSKNCCSKFHLGEADDAYCVVSFQKSVTGEISYTHGYAAFVDVLPPSLPVPRKIANELRKALEACKKEGLEDLPF